MARDYYRPEDFGDEDLILDYNQQLDDARSYFLTCIKPRLDRSYKLYIAYNGDRGKEIKKWQANIFVPYTQAVVETLMPRIMDARPDFGVQGRTEEDQEKAIKLVQLGDYTWEISKMDVVSEMAIRSALIYGIGFFQTSWKKDVREMEFLSSNDLLKKKLAWKKKKQTFYDAPSCEWVDNYNLWYDWHNVERENKQFWFKRLILNKSMIERRYPMCDKKRLKIALANPGGDLEDYGKIRYDVRLTQDEAIKGAEYGLSAPGAGGNRYKETYGQKNPFFEVFEWWQPLEDKYAVMVNGVPIFKNGYMPNPYDHKESVFIDLQFLKLPNEFEGYGIPMILENPQLMLNMIKNQRLDAMTLNIHKMWIVNPLANINKEELVTRPFGIIYSTDPGGVREVQFSDVKASAYKEEELIKGDMRYASGVDDFSMGVGQSANSATEVRHLRESTLERVRLFVNHLGDAYSDILRQWICLWRQFFTTNMIIRIVGDDGIEKFPLVEKDDLKGMFDYKATVIPSIAGQNDVDKKQGMDLFQLLINLPFIDPRRLTSKVLHNWGWSLDGISKNEAETMGAAQEGSMPGMPGAPMQGGQPGEMTPEMMMAMQQQAGGEEQSPLLQQGSQSMRRMGGAGAIKGSVIQQVLQGLSGQSPLQELGSPINLLKSGALPPTVLGPGQKTTNLRGMNRTGKVNTNIPLKQNYNEQSKILNRTNNIQR